MRWWNVFSTAGVLAGAFLCFAAVAPENFVIESRNGNVTYDHAKHLEREKGDCTACHPKFFEQSTQAPLNYKAGVHKTAEKAKKSCGGCHYPDGAAFASLGNCAKCHVKK
jgi:c(7)-type cytochrome triheme protein